MMEIFRILDELELMIKDSKRCPLQWQGHDRESSVPGPGRSLESYTTGRVRNGTAYHE